MYAIGSSYGGVFCPYLLYTFMSLNTVIYSRSFFSVLHFFFFYLVNKLNYSSSFGKKTIFDLFSLGIIHFFISVFLLLIFYICKQKKC